MKPKPTETNNPDYVRCPKMKNGGRRHRSACAVLQYAKLKPCLKGCEWRKDYDNRNS
jgi:hypothetical protein